MSIPVNRADTSRRRLRVLVVDDNRDAADSMALLVKLWDHDVQVAYDGTSALESACSFSPDVMLLDIGLPKMDGLQLAKHVRQLESCAAATLIAVTGFADGDHRSQVEPAFDHYLVKPVCPVELEQLLVRSKTIPKESGAPRQARNTLSGQSAETAALLEDLRLTAAGV
jgi:CheY-like chemotaxis protein